MWYSNIRLTGADGRTQFYPTRALFTGAADIADIADFTEDQHIEAAAVHELGHLLTHWHHGSYLSSFIMQKDPLSPVPSAWVGSRRPWGAPLRPVLVAGAAGERACDRWLHEEGLWTSARAVYAEVQGERDRKDALAEDPSITFDGGPNDYRHLQDEADRVLDEVWPILRRGLHHFCRYIELTGDDACVLLRIKNNPAI